MADRRTINSSTGIKKVFTTIAISPAVSWRLAACADARSRSETTFRRSSSNSFEAESRNRPPTSCHMCHICHIPTQASANRNFEPFEPLPQLSSTARQASGDSRGSPPPGSERPHAPMPKPLPSTRENLMLQAPASLQCSWRSCCRCRCCCCCHGFGGDGANGGLVFVVVLSLPGFPAGLAHCKCRGHTETRNFHYANHRGQPYAHTLMNLMRCCNCSSYSQAFGDRKPSRTAC